MKEERKRMRMRGKRAVVLLTLLMAALFSLSMCASAKTVTSTVKVKNGGDITSALQKELNKASQKPKNTYHITVEPGTYKIKGTLKIYSNTSLYLDGVTFKRVKNNVVMLRFGGDKNYKGYSQCKNVTISGGTWDGSGKTGDLMRFAHGQNMRLENVTFTNVKNAHHIEIAACKDVTFTGCTFTDYSGKKGSNHVEALQIDIMRKEHFNYYPAYDETPCVNVTVSGCTFDNLHSGVGTHSVVIGSYHSNIQIVNNTFKDMYGYAIIGMNYKNSRISGNTIEDCGFGIEFKTLSSSAAYKSNKKKSKTITNLNMEISGNTIDVVQTGYNCRISGIRIYGAKLTKAKGKIPAGNYRIAGMTVQNNVITQNCRGVAISLEGVDNSAVRGNQITCNFAASGFHMSDSGGYGICLEDSTGNDISGNTLVNRKSAAYASGIVGLCVYKSSDNNTVSGNLVEDFNVDGITVKNASGVTVKQNKVTGSGRYGILANNGGSMTAADNQVSGSGKDDMRTLNGGKINGQTM